MTRPLRPEGRRFLAKVILVLVIFALIWAVLIVWLAQRRGGL